MKKAEKGARFTLGATLEPVKVESECVTVGESFRGYVVLTGHGRRTANGEWRDPVVTLECPSEWVTSRVCEFLASLVEQHGFTDERPDHLRLVLRGGLVS